MSERTCSTCLHWKAGTNGPGECHRHAPRPDAARYAGAPPTAPLLVYWPLTLAQEWCGEWQPRPVARRKEG